MTRGKPQQETSVGDGGDGSHVGGGGGWGGGNDDSIAGGGCGGDDSDGGAAAESRPSSSDGASAQEDTQPSAATRYTARCRGRAVWMCLSTSSQHRARLADRSGTARSAKTIGRPSTLLHESRQCEFRDRVTRTVTCTPWCVSYVVCDTRRLALALWD